jgi:hypothetical protein
VPCTVVDLPGGSRAILCTRGRKRRHRCAFCRALGDILCDGVVDGRSCDARCCRACALSVGKNRDLCPECQRYEVLDAQADLEIARR